MRAILDVLLVLLASMRINKVLQARLEGKGKDFARKYQELFAEKQTANQAKKD